MKLGFEACILPRICLEKMKRRSDIRLIGVSSVKEAVAIL